MLSEGRLAMREFVFLGGWFDHYETRLVGRYTTFKLALNVLLQQGGRHIVETGTLRSPGSWAKNGCSTLIFGEFAARYDRHLWTCDINPTAIDTAARATEHFAANITYICSDS